MSVESARASALKVGSITPGPRGSGWRVKLADNPRRWHTFQSRAAAERAADCVLRGGDPDVALLAGFRRALREQKAKVSASAPHRASRVANPTGLTSAQAAVLGAIYAGTHNDGGCTDAGSAFRLHMSLGSAAKRRLELVDAGLVEDAGYRAPTGPRSTGRVWRITASGVTALLGPSR